MKVIGLIGGITWYSSVDYYKYINQEVNRRLGGDEAARMLLYSVNYGEIKKFTLANDWKSLGETMRSAARKLEAAGADCLLLGANTMHHIADEIAKSVNIPFLHIADPTADAILKKGIRTVALLGTKYTMQFDFYKEKLAARGIHTLIPKGKDIDIVNNGIYEELGKGIVNPVTKKNYLNIIDGLIKEGAEGLILGCTEIPLMIKDEDSPIPVFDTTLLHAKAAVNFALGD